MKKSFFSLLFITLLGLMVTACNDDEKNPEITFAEVVNDAPDHITFRFYSPDPQCAPRMAEIFATSTGGNLVIKATNVSSFSLGFLPDPDNNFVTCPVEGGSDNNECYNCEEGHWTATLTGNNEITFSFNPILAEDATETPVIASYMPVAAIVDGKVVNTQIAVLRASIDINN